MSRFNIHRTAIVDEGARLGVGVQIWHWSHVRAGAKIGENSSLGQNVYIGANVRVGRRVKIQNNVSVYDCVELEDDVFCGPSVVFTNVVNPRSEYPRKDEFKSTIVRRGATLGANSTIVCGITIGEYAFIAAGSVVTKNIRDFALVKGVPAKQYGWMSRYGERMELEIEGTGSWKCPQTGECYVLEGRSVRLLECES